MYITFNYVKEFIEELKHHYPIGEVRLTNLYMMDNQIPHEHWIRVVATVRIQNDIIRLDHHVGNTFGKKGNVLKKADEVQDEIRAYCKEKGVEVRGGILKERLED